jgi:hypothetical protein
MEGNDKFLNEGKRQALENSGFLVSTRKDGVNFSVPHARNIHSAPQHLQSE